MEKPNNTRVYQQEPQSVKNTMKKIKSASLMTAIKTPYKPNGVVDLECYDLLVEAQIKNGVEGLIVCGTTGKVI